MNKEDILEVIKQTAKANGGSPLGKRRFLTETGIKESEWFGRYWARWGDAIREAGFSANTLKEAYPEIFLIEKFIELTRQLGRLPVDGDLRMKGRNDDSFPSHRVFSRLGSKRIQIAKILNYCRDKNGFEDVVLLCGAIPECNEVGIASEPVKIGYVYLLKHGSRREYKIGKTYNPLRREGEISLQLPERLNPIHYIKTDDPSGIEAYWHLRFSDKRKEGEWFALTQLDIQAFKKWKRIY